MSKFAKIIMTILVIVIAFILHAFFFALAKSQGGSGNTGIVGLIILFAAIGAVRAIWKKDKNSDNSANGEKNNTSILQK